MTRSDEPRLKFKEDIAQLVNHVRVVDANSSTLDNQSITDEMREEAQAIRLMLENLDRTVRIAEAQRLVRHHEESLKRQMLYIDHLRGEGGETEFDD